MYIFIYIHIYIYIFIYLFIYFLLIYSFIYIRHAPLGTCCVSRSIGSSIHSLSSTSFQVELGAPGGGGSSSPFLWSFLRGVPEIRGKYLHPPLQASKNPTFSLSCLILALLGAILDHLGALRPHLVAKLLQDGAQMAQHSPT